MISACEPFLADAVASRHCAGELGLPNAVDGGLMALEVGKASEICRRSAGGDVAGPSSVLEVMS
jgi:hypothetical protein